MDQEDVANFDFITDEDLRRSLESDLRELNLCHGACAWKAVHVLAGSIIEAVLIDYLVSAGRMDAASANTKDLGQLIDSCKGHAVLSNKAIELTTIVRSYRNLIHPGRVLRLSERVDEHGATIARAVIEIVVDEVASKKKETFGYTAEQVIRKVRQDPSALSIAEHLLRGTHSAELRRLMLKVLPTTYLEACEADVPEEKSFAQRLSQLFRLGIGVADPTLRTLVGSKYVSVLKEEPELIVRNYELGLFRGGDLAYVDEKDRSLVVAHFLGTMRQGLNEGVLKAAQGITVYLHGESLKEFLKILATSLVRDKTDDIRKHGAAKLLYHEQWEIETSSKELEQTIEQLQEEYKWSEQMKKVLGLMGEVVTIPF